jgi:hypothetical protein
LCFPPVAWRHTFPVTESTSERVGIFLELEGTPNFRDLGGYQTKDGRFIRWGLIYRSGMLTYLTPADYSYLAHLGIRVICDFRTAGEQSCGRDVDSRIIRTDV